MGFYFLNETRLENITSEFRKRSKTKNPSFTGTNVVETSFYNALNQLRKRTTMAGPALKDPDADVREQAEKLLKILTD